MDDERPRIFVSDKEARSVILSAVNKIADVVTMTLGPSGRNALIDRGYRSPRITNDGVFIAKSLDLTDPLEQVVATQLVEIADRANKDAGDGTTTAITIARSLIKTGMDKIGGGGSFVSGHINVMDIKREINESCDVVLKELDKQKKPAKDIKVLRNVATTSLEDDSMSEVIADMVMKIGEDGFIAVEEGFHGEIETEIIQGMQFDGKYAHDFMINTDRKTAEYDDAKILITNHSILEEDVIMPFTHKFFQGGNKELVIMAPKFSFDVLKGMAQLYNAVDAKKQPLNLKILAIKIPSLTEDQIKDVCAYTKATFIDREKGGDLTKALPESCGNVRKLVVDDDKVVMTGGAGNVKERIKELKAEIKVEKDEMFRKKLEIRIASLDSGIGVIKVGSSTEAEKGYIKLKLEDAVFATQHAYREGVVEGGGKALKKIAKKLGKDDILYEALLSPYNQIQDNAGGSLKIPEHVIDPIRVTKTALKHACSVSGMMLTTNTVVAIERLKEQADATLEIARALDNEQRTNTS